MAWALPKEVMSLPSLSIIQRRLDCVPFGLQGLEERGRVGVRRRTWRGVGVGEHRSAFWFTSLVEAPGGVNGAPCLSFPMAAGTSGTDSLLGFVSSQHAPLGSAVQGSLGRLGPHALGLLTAAFSD